MHFFLSTVNYSFLSLCSVMFAAGCVVCCRHGRGGILLLYPPVCRGGGWGEGLPYTAAVIILQYDNTSLGGSRLSIQCIIAQSTQGPLRISTTKKGKVQTNVPSFCANTDDLLGRASVNQPPHLSSTWGFGMDGWNSTPSLATVLRKGGGTAVFTTLVIVTTVVVLL